MNKLKQFKQIIPIEQTREDVETYNRNIENFDMSYRGFKCLCTEASKQGYDYLKKFFQQKEPKK